MFWKRAATGIRVPLNTQPLLVALAVAIEQQINLGIGSELPASPRSKQVHLGAGEAFHGAR